MDGWIDGGFHKKKTLPQPPAPLHHHCHHHFTTTTITSEEPRVRDSWWSEIRMEMRSHTRALNCNVVIGYSEHTCIHDQLIILSAFGTAAVLTDEAYDSMEDVSGIGDGVFMSKKSARATGRDSGGVTLKEAFSDSVGGDKIEGKELKRVSLERTRLLSISDNSDEEDEKDVEKKEVEEKEVEKKEVEEEEDEEEDEEEKDGGEKNQWNAIENGVGGSENKLGEECREDFGRLVLSYHS